MTCPFLSETRVRTCTAASRRKLIAASLVAEPGEKCGTPRHTGCTVFRDKGGAEADSCPYFEERPVQFCTAVSVPQYVPYSTPDVTTCGSEAYQYCDAYRAMTGKTAGAEEVAEGVAVLERLHYATNHLWLNIGESGLCHIGIDALMARFLGTVERVTMLTRRGVLKPTVVLTVQGVDWPMVFPSPILVESADLRLRANPRPITEDPYGTGWLFCGWVPPGVTVEQTCRDLMHGRRAVAWLRQEAQRLSERVTACLAPAVGGVPVAADGGSLAKGAGLHLMREQLLGLLNEFFPSHSERTWER